MVGTGHFNKSEMALFSECTDRYAQKLLDTADIVREAMFQQLTWRVSVSGLPTIQHMSCSPVDTPNRLLESVAWLHDNIRDSSRRTHAPELFPQRECDGVLRRWEAPPRLSMQARYGNVARLPRK